MTTMKPMKPMKSMEPMKPLQPMAPVERWWPSGLGEAASTGSQDDLRYAVFPEAQRLAVQRSGTVTLYETGEHRIAGVAQGANGDGEPVFSSQNGTVALSELRETAGTEKNR